MTSPSKLTIISPHVSHPPLLYAFNYFLSSEKRKQAILKRISLLTDCTISSGSKVDCIFIQSIACHSYSSEERLRTLEKDNRRLSETVYSTMDDIHTWRSSHQTTVRLPPFTVSSLYNLAFRLTAVHSPGNLLINGRSTTSPLAHPLNPKCLILPTLHPTVSSMISPIDHNPIHKPRTVSLTIHHPLLKFPLPHDHPDRRVRIISRVLRLAWRTPRGKFFQLPCESIKLITMIGKTMPCSFAMVLQVRSF
jgi:hypothetical protein